MDWFDSAKLALEEIKNWDDVVLVFHNDADGLASGAIAKVAMEKMEKKTTLYCIEKMYPEVIKKIHEHHNNALFLYLDIGGGEVDLLDQITKTRTIILDHHKTKHPENENVVNLDPELYGMNGGKDACGATITYLVFRDIVGKGYSDLAIVGMQEIPDPKGLNDLVLKDYPGNPKKKLERIGKVPRSVSRDLTILGSVGYYQGGVELGLRLALNGYDKEIKEKIKFLEEKRKGVVRQLVTTMKLNETKNIQWIDVGDAFKGMGTKTVGTFCSYLVHRNIAPDKILLGFMNVEKGIPKLNGIDLELDGDYAKVSARAPDMIKEKINAGEIPGLGTLISKSCSKLSGFGDGHDFAASGIIPIDAKEKLVQEIEAELGDGGLGRWI